MSFLVHSAKCSAIPGDLLSERPLTYYLGVTLTFLASRQFDQCTYKHELLDCVSGASRGQGQNVQQGRQSSTEGPWQPEDVETQREFMRQRAVQRAQVWLCA